MFLACDFPLCFIRNERLKGAIYHYVRCRTIITCFAIQQLNSVIIMGYNQAVYINIFLKDYY